MARGPTSDPGDEHLRISEPETFAGGVPAARVSLQHIRGATGLVRGARALLKFFPGWGNIVCGAVAGAGTYAIGRAAVVYFLEGLTLTGLSGLIGIVGAAALMGALGSVVGNNDMGFDPPRLVPWSAAMAMGSLTLCGIVAGLYPARQAAMLQPVEALRKE